MQEESSNTQSLVVSQWTDDEIELLEEMEARGRCTAKMLFNAFPRHTLEDSKQRLYFLKLGRDPEAEVSKGGRPTSTPSLHKDDPGRPDYDFAVWRMNCIRGSRKMLAALGGRKYA